jgi:hypothetical protein
MESLATGEIIKKNIYIYIQNLAKPDEDCEVVERCFRYIGKVLSVIHHKQATYSLKAFSLANSYRQVFSVQRSVEYFVSLSLAK